MANKNAAVTRLGNWEIHTWSGITNADAAVAERLVGNYSDLFVRFTGTFDAATAKMAAGFTAGLSSALVEQSVVDRADAVISKTAAGYSELKSRWPYMGPTFSGGGGSQNITVELWVCLVMPGGQMAR